MRHSQGKHQWQYRGAWRGWLDGLFVGLITLASALCPNVVCWILGGRVGSAHVITPTGGMSASESMYRHVKTRLNIQRAIVVSVCESPRGQALMHSACQGPIALAVGERRCRSPSKALNGLGTKRGGSAGQRLTHGRTLLAFHYEERVCPLLGANSERESDFDW